ncbi:MAG TPA: helix-turn-helix transcriptional regulator [Bacillota bacterium]|nr:helix-turn-helix transcriptional regulator [Bacillota bacterium]
MTGPSQQAKQALGARLREIRRDANLSGRALAALCGWHFTKVSKLEHGTQTPTEDDLREWCRASEAEGQAADLIATMRAIDLMYVEWRRAQRSGMRHSQESRNPLYERTTLFRIYESGLVPGLLQTADYAATIMSAAIERNQIPNDLDAAVAARLERQQYLYSGDRRFMVVLEEQALRTRVGSTDTMQGQLDRLLALVSLQRLSLGILPLGGERLVWPSVGFWIFDQSTVRLETPSAELTITQRSEIVVFEKRFEGLQDAAVYGKAARYLIRHAFLDLSKDRE